MRTKVLIIEDNQHQFFATKQVLVSRLHLDVSVFEVANSQEMVNRLMMLNPELVIFRPIGGLPWLLEKFRQRRLNRRNSEIMIAVAPDLDTVTMRRLQELTAKDFKRFAQAA